MRSEIRVAMPQGVTVGVSFDTATGEREVIAANADEAYLVGRAILAAIGVQLPPTFEDYADGVRIYVGGDR